MQGIKQTYNKLLQRYYNGCNYIEKHLKEADKYLPAVLELLGKLNNLLEQIQKKQLISEAEILGGFELC